MRMMLKFTLPVEKGNAAFRDGSLARVLESIMNKLKPEAAYFAPFKSKRGAMVFFNLTDVTDRRSPRAAFLNLNAETELQS